MKHTEKPETYGSLHKLKASLDGLSHIPLDNKYIEHYLNIDT